MKVTFELDTTKPLFIEVMRLITYGAFVPPSPPVTAPPSPPVPESVPAESTPAEPPPAPAPIPVPNRKNLLAELNDVFVRANVSNPVETQKIAAKFRTDFSLDSANWTEDQLKQAISQVQALIVL